MTGLARTAELSRCGRQYATEDEARKSAEYRTEKSGATYEHAECWTGGHWHVREAASAPAPSRPVRRDTGPDQRTRGLVLARDGHSCIGCGKAVGGAFTWWSLQHRRARGTGGDNSVSSLLVMCGSATSPGCHRKAEDRGEEEHLKGWWLRSDESPLEHPVMYATASGPRWYLLDDSGGRTEVSPPAEWLAYEAARSSM